MKLLIFIFFIFSNFCFLSSKENKISSKENKISSKEDKISSKEDKISSKEDKISSKENKISSKEDKISVYDYIEKYVQLAVKEMEEFGIPASIKLGQGILESSYGNSSLALIANNHFGIKCGKNWVGDVYYCYDDFLNECFRKYSSSSDSFRDHSKFLKKPRYKKLFFLSRNDYKGWAKELKNSGYATAPDYDNRLIMNIEKYELWRFDNENSCGLENRIQGYLSSIKLSNGLTHSSNYINNQFFDKNISPYLRILCHENKGIKYIIINNGETIEKISKIYGISIRKLAYYNNFNKKNNLSPGQYFFLEKKKRYGFKDFYQVSKGETMYSISQKVGIQLKRLYYLNRIKSFEEPKSGDILWLKKRKTKF